MQYKHLSQNNTALLVTASITQSDICLRSEIPTTCLATRGKRLFVFWNCDCDDNYDSSFETHLTDKLSVHVRFMFIKTFQFDHTKKRSYDKDREWNNTHTHTHCCTKVPCVLPLFFSKSTSFLLFKHLRPHKPTNVLTCTFFFFFLLYDMFTVAWLFLKL